MLDRLLTITFIFQCRDTYYIESFHNVILIYAPKRIHFTDEVYNMRMNFALMDWVSCHIHFWGLVECMAQLEIGCFSSPLRVEGSKT